MNTVACQGALTPITGEANVSPEVVVYVSRGCVLVLGDDASAGDVVSSLNAHHHTVVFAPGVDNKEFGARVTAVGRRVTHVRGYLGAFQAEIHTGTEVTDIGVASPNPGRYFDLVLDLSQSPLIADEVKPLGYFAPGTDLDARQAAIEAIRGLVGRFTKPRYFNYQPELCAHSASGLPGCTQCLSVCSAQAITSTGARVHVDPYLCQGCASCTLACPTGTLSFNPAHRQALDERMQQALSAGPAGAPLVVHSQPLDEQTLAMLTTQGAVTLAVNPLPALGDELWFRALALGARALLLVNDGLLPGRTRELIASRVAQMQIMLTALGMTTSRVAWLSTDELRGWLAKYNAVAPPRPSGLPQVPSNKSWFKYKRLAWIDTLRRLGAATNAPAAIELPKGAVFGEVRVNRKRCTLCFACANLCPTRALAGRNDTTQQLVFQESACVQCGLCVSGCPEKAVSLNPRLAPKVMMQMSSTVLHQDVQLACKSCGTPFINRRLLALSLELLKGHPGMGNGGREALMRCPACRQKEMLDV